MTTSLITSVKNTASKIFTALDEGLGQLHFDIGHDYRDTVILAGSARSGTTWVAELINFDDSYRLIFEPMYAGRVRLCKAFSGRQYIRPDNKDPEFLEPVKTILSGRFRNGWADQYNRQLFPRKRLVKEIRANLYLYWLHVHFPEIPIVFLLRHPCAVVGSLHRRGWRHYTELDTYLKQELLMSDFLSPFRDELMKASTPLEVQIMRWCVETYVPFCQFKPGELHLAFYENFRVDPRREIARLFAYLGKPMDERVFEALDRPSKRTRFPKPKERGSSATSHDDWRNQFSPQELELAHLVLQRFGLHRLYREDGMPDLEAAVSLLGKHTPGYAPLLGG